MTTMENNVAIAKETKENLRTIMSFLKRHPNASEGLGLSQDISEMENILNAMADYFIGVCEAEIVSETAVVSISAEDTYSAPESNWDLLVMDFDAYESQTEDNFFKLKEIDERCRARGEVVGRYFATPVGDGNAIYQIQKLDKSNGRAFISLCDGINDGYVDRYFGREAWINADYAEQLVKSKDRVLSIIGF